MPDEKEPERIEKEEMNRQRYREGTLEITFENGNDIELKDFIDFYKNMRASYVWCVENVLNEFEENRDIQYVAMHSAERFRISFAKEGGISGQKHFEWLAEKPLAELEPVITHISKESSLKIIIGSF